MTMLNILMNILYIQSRFASALNCTRIFFLVFEKKNSSIETKNRLLDWVCISIDINFIPQKCSHY